MLITETKKQVAVIYWIYLFCASAMEIAWLYSLKYIDKDSIMAINWRTIFASSEPILTLLPVVGYIVFGVANVVLISMAMKGIPASTAFGIWMGLALVGAKIIDVMVYGEPYTYQQILFMCLILIGVVGLKAGAN